MKANIIFVEFVTISI